MIIPKNVRVGSMDYEVNVVDETKVLNGRQCYGLVDYDFHSIEIDSSIQDNQKMETTFLHELIHAVCCERGLNMSELGLSHEDMEYITDEIALGLHQVIRDNPQIFKVHEDAKIL